MVCRVISRDQKHGFALVTDYLTDPARDSVVMHTTLEPLPGTTTASLDRLKVYARYDAQIDNTGGGGKTNALPTMPSSIRPRAPWSPPTPPPPPGHGQRTSWARWPPIAALHARRAASLARRVTA
jgi:hypothetical protein